MPDILDHAKDLEMRQRQDALDKALKHSEPEQDIRDGVVICIDCGGDIHPARLKAKPNAARCIHCQQIEEQRHGR
jgi:DnaK suppressor protein